MLRMLDTLAREHLDEIERTSDWEYEFITNILERSEANEDYKLSDKQYECLTRIYNKYVVERRGK